MLLVLLPLLLLTMRALLRYDQDLCEEDACMEWWGNHQGGMMELKQESFAKNAEAVQASQSYNEQKAKQKNAKAEEQEMETSARFYKKEAEYAKCGAAASPMEEKIEKEANQKHRAAQTSHENAMTRAMAAKNKLHVVEHERQLAVQESADARAKAFGSGKVTSFAQGFFTWLEEAEDSEESD